MFIDTIASYTVKTERQKHKQMSEVMQTGVQGMTAAGYAFPPGKEGKQRPFRQQ